MADDGPGPIAVGSAVTAADVARAAGVSRSAVSRAFTPGAPVAEATRLHVQAVAERLGYAPNILARSLITGRSNLVAVVVNTLADLSDAPFFDRLFQGLQATGRQPLVVHTHGATDLAGVLRGGVAYQVDGALVFADTVTPAMVRSVFRSGAVVMMNGHAIPDAPRAGPVDAVGIDERTDLGRLTEGLARAGHERIAYLSGRPTAGFEDARHGAVADALARHGLAPIEVRAGDYSYETGAAAAAALLAGPDRPDALVCACDAMALGAMDAARSRGLAIPDDLSVVGFDDIPQAAWPTYALTTVRPDLPGVVAAAVDLLDRRLADPARPPEARRLPTTIEARRSARLA